MNFRRHRIRSVQTFFNNLLDELLTLDSGYVEAFTEACNSILDFKISCTQFEGGKHVGLRLQNGNLLPVDKMGEGILHILFFLSRLCSAQGKLFLIEEIENDLHPKALKGLLQLVIEKSALNQFIITTHNNIVLRYLGGAPKSKVFSVEMTLEDLKSKFSKDWPENHFRCFSSGNFENYYPKEFEQKVSQVLAMQHGLPKQKAKGDLAEEVVRWSLANPEKARADFAVSAKEVLDFLAEIHKMLS